MKTTTITLHCDNQIASVDHRIFGGFLEHMGRAVYEGVFDPKSELADPNGFRHDVLDALFNLHFTNMRYPGGNFASGYHWMDGVGPSKQRPTLRELAWQSTEPNTFGTKEYIQLCRQLNWSPMLTVNLGTGTPEEARNWVEYCNSPEGTYYSNLRVNHGTKEPFAVKMWCLGNEMDGPWQLGHVPASQYATRAQQTAKLMKDTDPTIELIACGSCAPDMPTYLEWDRIVLEEVGDYTDYISLHRYVGNEGQDTADYLAVTNSIDQQIEDMENVCHFVQSKMRRKKRQYLCFDEWNVWYRTKQEEFMKGREQFAPHLIEEQYNLEDALVVAGFLNSFVRHADSVKIANIAQIVNVIAPILTSKNQLLKQTIYYPLAMYSNRREGIALRPIVTGPAYESVRYGTTRFVDSSAILGNKLLHLFLINRSLTESAHIDINITGRKIDSLNSAEILTGSDPSASNTFTNPRNITPNRFKQLEISTNQVLVELPPLAFSAISLKIS